MIAVSRPRNTGIVTGMKSIPCLLKWSLIKIREDIPEITEGLQVRLLSGYK